MMLKCSGIHAYDFGEPTVALVRLRRDGRLGPNDRSVLEKRAGVEFVEKLRRIKLAQDEVPVHIIGLGATEDYGPNRNGDGFDRSECRQHHGTFQKYGRFYRNHANKDPDKSYGRFLDTAFNEPMKRIELLAGLNGSEKTAKANGGLVADKELELLERGDDIPTSMACKVAHDICSGCGNKARTRQEYCDNTMCKYGGLKDNIGRTFDDGHTLHARNPSPVWFDDSHVHKPADRIAWSLGRLEKAAAAGGRVIGLGGAALAEEIGLTMPTELMVDPFMPGWVAQHVKVAHRLAEIERQVEAEGPRNTDRAFDLMVQDPVREFPSELHTRNRLEHMLGALSQEKVALPLRDFLVLVSGDEKQASDAYEEVAAQLPGIYGRLTRSPALDVQVRDSIYAINSHGAEPPMSMQRWATKLAMSSGLQPKHLQDRVSLHVIRGLPSPRHRSHGEGMRKQAADMGGAERLARQYALYKLALASAIPATADQSETTIMNLLIRQNYVA
jgi:hypothetical protein